MAYSTRTTRRPLAAAGGIGAMIALVVTVYVATTVGFSGPTAYRTDGALNRAIGGLLLVQTAAVVAFALRFRSQVSTAGSGAMTAAVLGWLGMVVGNGLEFWLSVVFTTSLMDVPRVAFGLFYVSSILGGISLGVLGVLLLRDRVVPWHHAVLLVGYPLFDIVLFLTVGSLFLAPSLAALLLAGIVLRFPEGRRSTDTS